MVAKPLSILLHLVYTSLSVFILQCCCVSVGYAQLKATFFQMGRNELSQGHFTKAIEYFNLTIAQKNQLFDAYFFRAIAKEELDDYIGAEQDYSQAIAIYSNWANVYIARAVVRDKMLNYKDALQDYEKAISRDSTNPAVYFNRAITFLSMKKYQQAMDDCNHLERLRYNDINLYMVRGIAKAGLEQYSEAIKDYNYVIHKNGKNIFAYLQRAEAQAALLEKDSAMYDFNYVLKLDSVNTEALLNRALLNADALKYTDALKDLDNVIRLSKDNATAYFNRAILKSSLKDYDGALNDYDKVLDLYPQNILAYYNRAGLKYSQRDLKGALEDYNKVITLFPNFSDAYYNRSLVKRDLNKSEDAKKDYDKSVEIRFFNNTLTDSAKFEEKAKLMKLMSLSAGSENQKNIKGKVQFEDVNIQAQSIFSVSVLPTHRNLRWYKLPSQENNKDSVLMLVNNFADSIDEKSVFDKIYTLNAIIEKDSSNAVNYLNRAMLYSTIQRYNQSIADYNKSLLLDSGNAVTWFSRANTRYKLLELMYSFDEEPGLTTNGNIPGIYHKRIYDDHTYQMVVNDYSKALQLDPDFAYAWFNKATTKIKINDFKGAIEDYSMALSCNPKLSEVYYNRGLLLIILHDNTNACRDLSKAGELGIIEAYNVMKRFCYK